MKPSSSFARALTEIKRHSLRQAVRRRASSVTKRPPAILASILAWPRPWPISHSMAGKKASSEFCTRKAETPSSSTPNPRSSSNAGPGKRPANSEPGGLEHLHLVDGGVISVPQLSIFNFELSHRGCYFLSMLGDPLHLDINPQLECAETLASRFYT